MYELLTQVTVLVARSCQTLCDPMDYSPLGSSVHGISQARILEWIAISSSNRILWCQDYHEIKVDNLLPLYVLCIVLIVTMSMDFFFYHLEKQSNLFHDVLENGTVISGGDCRKADFSSPKGKLSNNSGDAAMDLGTLREGLWKCSCREP